MSFAFTGAGMLFDEAGDVLSLFTSHRYRETA